MGSSGNVHGFSNEQRNPGLSKIGTSLARVHIEK